MCQMSVVLEKNGQQELIMKNVAKLEAAAEGILVSVLFEEPRLVPGARVKTIDVMAGMVTLVPLVGGGQG